MCESNRRSPKSIPIWRPDDRGNHFQWKATSFQRIEMQRQVWSTFDGSENAETGGLPLVKPFRCLLCDAVFGIKTRLKAHYRKMHGRSVPDYGDYLRKSLSVNSTEEYCLVEFRMNRQNTGIRGVICLRNRHCYSFEESDHIFVSAGWLESAAWRQPFTSTDDRLSASQLSEPKPRCY